MNLNHETNCKAIAIGAWAASLVWFVIATAVFLGFSPFSFVAWAVPAWVLLRRTATWWRAVGNPMHAVAYKWLCWALWGLVATVAVLMGVVASGPAMSSGPTLVDSILRGVAMVCLLFPPLLVAWAVWRTARVPTRGLAC